VSWLERRFRLSERGTSVGRELLAGLATFSTLSYVLFVHPALLASPPCGMDARGVLFATCVASAAACFLMAFLANWPIALAPAMGHNVFFAFTVCGALGLTWQQALAANLLAAAVFLALTWTGLREAVVTVLPSSLQHAIAVGIGLLLATLGLSWAGLIRPGGPIGVQLGGLSQPAALVGLFGLAVGGLLMARGSTLAVPAAIFASAAAGLVASASFDLVQPVVRWHGAVGAPPAPDAALQLDFAGLFARPAQDVAAVIAVMLFLILFDTVGTLVGVGARAGYLVDGRLPREARGAFTADALGTVIGAPLGTSTVTCYVESAAGIAVGGRTGLTAACVGVLFLLALFLTPLLEMLGAPVPLAHGGSGHPVLAPALILVGALMCAPLARIRWDDAREAIPALLAILIMQLALSIAAGIAWGIVAASAIDLAAPGPRRASPALHALAVLVMGGYALL
jgi:AGZA family xanthine/uracil permease-like MFS transporter